MFIVQFFLCICNSFLVINYEKVITTWRFKICYSCYLLMKKCYTYANFAIFEGEKAQNPAQTFFIRRCTTGIRGWTCGPETRFKREDAALFQGAALILTYGY